MEETISQRWYGLLAHLPLEVESYELERRERSVSSGFTRVTTVVALHGNGHTGCGEDVTYDSDDHDSAPAGLPLAGRHSLDSFSALLGGSPLFTRPPRSSASIDHRRWGFESAALDLALRQAGLSLGAALGLTYRPVRFVVSTREDIRPWLEVYPALEFKLDPTPDWTEERLREIAATGRVRVVDFKAFYTGTPVDNPPDPALYRRVLEALPEAIVEDAGMTPETEPVLASARDRLSYDAPVHSWQDVARLPIEPRYLNIKPSRFGTVARLFECLEAALRAGIILYGGGQFELGPGRGQIQALASLLYADSPNDVAPNGYNEAEPQPGLEPSPLQPPATPLGFSFEG